MKRQSRKNQSKNYKGDIIHVAYNPIRRKYEQVFSEDEIPTNRIITMYWCNAGQTYVTIPENER